MNSLQRQLGTVVLSVGVLLSGCSSQDAATPVEKAVVVEVQQLEEARYPTYLSYLGNVTVEELKTYSFLMAGKLASLSVQKGDYVETGQEIARLETTELQYAIDAANGQLQAAQSAYEKALNGALPEDKEQAKLAVNQAAIQVDQANNVVAKAKENYDFIVDQYNRQKKLYEAGAISQYELEKLELDLDMSQLDYENAKQQLAQAEVGLSNAKQTLRKIENGTRAEDIESLKAQVDQAKANMDAKQEMLNDAILYADCSGYISELPVKVGEVVNAGTPIAIMRNPAKLVQTGVTQQDYSKIQVGTNAVVSANEQTYEGTVSYLKDLPDMQTRTYTAEISFAGDIEWPLGTVVTIDFDLGKHESIAVPIRSLLNDGEKDYVYVVEDGRAIQKVIEIIKINEENAIVKGLTDGDVLVTKGMKALRGGTLVTIVDELDTATQADEGETTSQSQDVRQSE